MTDEPITLSEDELQAVEKVSLIAMVSAQAETSKPLRTITGRGLGPDEEDAVWRDKEGDFWRWSPERGSWMLRGQRGPFTFFFPFFFPSFLFSPYTELSPEELTALGLGDGQ